MLTPRTATSLTPVQQRVAHDIVDLVRRAGHGTGTTLTETKLADHLGTSRSPVRAALAHLARCGVLSRASTRGFELTKDASHWTEIAEIRALEGDDPIYLGISEDRRRGRLPDNVSEAELMRRYGIARSTLRKVLSRIAEEGWMERRAARGWCFRPVIDSRNAYEESRRYCQVIEPSALLMPSFKAVLSKLHELRQEQARIAAGRAPDLTALERFDANQRFHETLAAWSGNRCVVQSVRYVTSLRRMSGSDDTPRREAHTACARDHIAILDAIEAEDMAAAARLMREHLDGSACP